MYISSGTVRGVWREGEEVRRALGLALAQRIPGVDCIRSWLKGWVVRSLPSEHHTSK